jgi:enamine deaminase RidA (YjgF/YER057c/UK114 family)
MTSTGLFAEVGATRTEREAKLTFSHGYRAGNTVHLSGIIAADESGQIQAPDLAGQAAYIYQRIGELLREIGVAPTNVVKTTDYVTTTSGYRDTARIRRAFFGNHRPAATGVVVAGLLHPQALIEIDAVVVLDGESVAHLPAVPHLEEAQ